MLVASREAKKNKARRATRGRAGVVAAAALGGLAAYVVLPLAL